MLVAGGVTGSTIVGGRTLVLASAEIYSSSSSGGNWSRTDNMFNARAGHTATLLADGRVLVAGGDTGGGYTAELYTP